MSENPVIPDTTVPGLDVNSLLTEVNTLRRHQTDHDDTTILVPEPIFTDDATRNAGIAMMTLHEIPDNENLPLTSKKDRSNIGNLLDCSMYTIPKDIDLSAQRRLAIAKHLRNEGLSFELVEL